ncbi:hypothetical protein M3Y99_00508800 [Aphelenchoides fujianensis]|nr:hypothetical protein M3Y99_00508800 [Aphelenchoides fujianensis]
MEAAPSTAVDGTKSERISKYPAEFTFFVQNGRFEDDPPEWTEPMDENTPDRFDVDEHNYGHVIKTITETFERSSVFKHAEKERLKKAVIDVMIHRKPRTAAVKDHKVNCINFSTVLANIYRKLKLSPSGAKWKKHPQFELNLLEIQINDGEENGAAAKAKRRPKGDAADGEAAADGAERPVVKKTKKTTGSSSFGAPNSSANYHGTFTRRLGDAVPPHWKEHADLTRFLIAKSVELTLTRGEKDNIQTTLNKINAIETVILENGNCKNAAAANNMNYSTLHNYTHRAMTTISSVLGAEEVPEVTRELLAKRTPFEEICTKLKVKRAPTLARFVPPRLQAAGGASTDVPMADETESKHEDEQGDD